MTITPLRLGGVLLHPVSVLGRYLPLRWQDANALAGCQCMPRFIGTGIKRVCRREHPRPSAQHS
jgi:hypothetical protein